MRKSLIFLGVLFAVMALLLVGMVALSDFETGEDGISFGDKIGVIEISGPITEADEYVAALRKFRKDDDIKALILRVNSPGGAVAPSQEIHREVQRTAASKPVVVSMGSLAASGGYYVCAPATRIFANPGTITGSIGVLMKFTNLEELYDKIGLKVGTIKTGRFKDIGSTSRPMTKEDKKLLNELLGNIHEQFMKAVSRGRKISYEKVKRLSDGRIFTGEQAQNLGLVDRLGGFTDAVDEAKRLSGIKGRAHLKFHKKRKPGILDLLIEDAVEVVFKKLLYEDDIPRIGYLFSLP